MQTAGTQHLIDRTYRESGQYQWVRETFLNAEEAGATRVELGIEWQAVENLGVHRRLIADDGRGMTADELVEFFNTFGGGGKPIGGAHENFGVGAKTSLLPWNRYGMVVISWVDGEASMIWVQQDEESGEYGLRLFEAEDPDSDEIALDEVVEPFLDEEHGCNWADVGPEWIQDHGTVIVLLGDEPTQDTVLGDPSRDETDIKGISSYLNRRLWEVQDSMEVIVDELRTNDRAMWPRSEDEGHGPQPKGGRPDRRTNPRTIRGAKYFIEYPTTKFKNGKLDAADEVMLSDGTIVEWYLWSGDRPAVQSYAAIGGFIAALYKNELYDVSTHHSTYRAFGVGEAAVRSKLWLVVRPPLLDDEGRHGVYPRTDRNSLLLKGGPSAGGPLPFSNWGAEFSENLPDEILAALKEARVGRSGTLGDDAWRERLIERFGSRWRLPKLRARAGGKERVQPEQLGGRPVRVRRRKRRKNGKGGGGGGGTDGEATIGTASGTTPATRVKVAGGIPRWEAHKAEDFESGMLAAWQPNHPDYPEGCVLINVDHPVLRAEVEYWQAQYPDHLAEEVGQEVVDVYGEVAVAKVAHSEHLKGIVPSKKVDEQFRSEAALTMALLGLIGEEAIIAPRVGGKFRKRREPASA
jgi:hypothetical protein